MGKNKGNFFPLNRDNGFRAVLSDGDKDVD